LRHFSTVAPTEVTTLHAGTCRPLKIISRVSPLTSFIKLMLMSLKINPQKEVSELAIEQLKESLKRSSKIYQVIYFTLVV
jgi:hypothetical protein